MARFGNDLRGIQNPTPIPDHRSAHCREPRVYGHRFTAYAAWKAALKPGDPAGQYRFYRFVPERVKILDEAEFGDAVFVQAAIVRG